MSLCSKVSSNKDLAFCEIDHQIFPNFASYENEIFFIQFAYLEEFSTDLSG